MKDRIKNLRKELKLTQQEFADRIGVKRNTVGLYEIGQSGISDTVIKAICREFGVNETWLRTGEGEMFRPRTNEEILTEFAADLAFEGDESFKKKVVTALAKMDEETWAMFEQWFWDFIEAFQDAENKKEQE